VAKQFQAIGPEHRDFILRQRVFFVASAAEGSRVNVSPKGLDSLRIIGPTQVAYLDRTGSGNETAAHIAADGRLTLMVCAFGGPPMILRAHGRGRLLLRGTRDYDHFLAAQFGGNEPLGARQIVMIDVDLVQTSCGFGVPLFDYSGERASLDRWAMAQGEDGLTSYRREHNARSIDDLPAPVPGEDALAQPA
jgi:hypothetical protein